MQRVEAGADLHLLELLHRAAVREVDAICAQGRTAIREVIFHNEVLRLLGVDKRRNKGVPGRLYRRHIFQTVGRQSVADRGIRARGNLVDGRPGEGNFVVAGDVCGEACVSRTVFCPVLCKVADRVFQPLAVV